VSPASRSGRFAACARAVVAVALVLSGAVPARAMGLSEERALPAYDKARELSAKNTPERKEVEKAIEDLRRALDPLRR